MGYLYLQGSLMRRSNTNLRLLRLLLLAAAVSGPQEANAQSATAAREAALHVQTLHGRTMADLVDTELQNQKLIEALEIGDLPTILKSLEAYSADNEILRRPEFVRVRTALEKLVRRTRSDPSLTLSSRFEKSKPKPRRLLTDVWVKQRREELRRSLDRLQTDLYTRGANNAEQWKRYLQWDAVRRAVDETDPNRLLQLRLPLFERYEGLGRKSFVRVRDDLDLLAQALYLHNAQEEGFLPEQVQLSVEQLTRSLQEFAVNRSEVAASNIGGAVTWLELANQASEITGPTRQLHWRPNIYGQASQRLAAAGIDDDYQDLSPVRDYLMKTSISGTAATSGRFSLYTSTADGRVDLIIGTRAIAHSRTTSTRGKVHVFNQGQTCINGQKVLHFYPSGVLTADPATAWCNTNSTITGVSHRIGLVRRIAYRKALKYQDFGEDYASRKAEDQTRKELDDRVNEIVRNVNRDYEKTAVRPLQRFDAFPRNIQVSSAPDRLRGAGLVASRFQIGAATAPPPVDQIFDATIQIHESALRNVLENIVQGRDLTRDSAIEILKSLKQKPSEELTSSNDFLLDFTQEHPIFATFEDDLLRIGFYCDYLKVFDDFGKPQSASFVKVEATYRHSISGDHLVLTRKGDVELSEFGRDRNPLIIWTGFIGAAKKSVERVIKPEFRIPVARKLPKPWDRAGRLRPVMLEAQNGWLTVRLKADWLR